MMVGRDAEKLVVQRCLAVARLGDDDRLGWWRSHSADDAAEYVLAGAFPNTWLATGLEMAMESARIRHEAAFERPRGTRPAVHLFSDHLPFHRLVRSWLLERKLARDHAPLQWLQSASVEQLFVSLGETRPIERRGNGVYVGDVSWNQLEDEAAQLKLLESLLGAYPSMASSSDFLAPYADLID